MTGARSTRVLGWRLAAWLFVVLVSACGGGGGGGGGGNGGDDLSVSMTTTGGATTVASGGTLSIRAQVLNASNPNVAWSLEGATCPNDCGTIVSTGVDAASYRAPASVPARFTVTVRATSLQDGAKSGTVTLTVTASCAANLAPLNGPYALLLQGFELGGRQALAMVGSVTADGCGGITAGSLDYGPTPTGSAVPVTGTYDIGADRRGTLTLGNGNSSLRVAIALDQASSGVAQQVAVAASGTGTGAFAGLWSGAGMLWRQDPFSFALAPIAGNYAYLLNGWTAGGQRKAIGGTVTLAASGSFASGLQDEHQFRGTLTQGRSWTGSAAAPAASGGRTDLSAGAFGGGGRGVLVVVDGARSVVLLVDAAGTVLSGPLVKQRSTFDATSVQGGVVSWQTANFTTPGFEGLTTTILSLFAADGAAPIGTLSSRALDINAGGNITAYPAPGAITYTYSVAANGQVTVFNASTAGGKYYLISRNTGFLLGFDEGVSIGEVRPQSGSSLGLSSLNGRYFATQAPGAALASSMASGVATSAGNGVLGTVMDIGSGGSFAARTDAIGGALVDTGNGRFTDAYGNVMYLLAGEGFVVMPLDRNEIYPVVRVFER